MNTSPEPFLPLVITVLSVSLTLLGMHWLLIGRHTDLGNEAKFSRQLIMLSTTLIGLLAIILTLPITDSSRNQLLGLVGILFSGILAFSSASILGNLAAGVLLRITKPFKTGDFIRVEDYFGRVSERGLFETEIQTETRELVSLPNSYCITKPVKTIRSSGTIISVSLSLGYDINHKQIESLLVKAAKATGLEEAFVHILELGNFSITYRVSGLLPEPKFLISARSELYSSVLDTLHAEQIEIMSPTYMNQRKLSDLHRAIPKNPVPQNAGKTMEGLVEAVAFDKAEEAGELEREKQKIIETIQHSENARKQTENEKRKKHLAELIEQKQESLLAVKKAIETVKKIDVNTD